MKKYGLLVGVDEYRDKMISRVPFARADATALAERLRTRCEFDYVHVLSDSDGPDTPELGHIIDALQDIAFEVKPGDLFLFFFAGHGVERNGLGYLLTIDSRQMFPAVGTLPLEMLKESLGLMAATQRILLIDSCRNNPEAGRGVEANRMGEGFYRDIVAVARAKEAPDITTCLLIACQSGQRAREWPSKGHGVFSHFLLAGLDGDAWKGTELDFDDLAAYTRQEVVRWSSSTPGIAELQVPWYEKFGAPARVILGTSHEGDRLPTPDRRVKCPLCGRRNDSDETFECQVCHRDFLCTRHWDEGRQCCADCVVKLSKEEQELRNQIRSDADAEAISTGEISKLIFEMNASRLPLWRKAAEAGMAEGYYLIGLCYNWGIGVEMNQSEAINWFRKAAEQGYASAQNKLGECYYKGEGVSINDAEAVKWYCKAAEQGHAGAQDNLGHCYFTGRGVNKDETEAANCFRKAAEQGHAGARFMFDLLRRQ